MRFFRGWGCRTHSHSCFIQGMEVTVRINQAWIKDVQRFLLRCRVQAAGSGEAHEGSVSISQQQTSKHEFSFTFASRPPQLSFLFVATSPRHESTPSRQEKELGRSAGTLNTAESGLERTRTLLLSQRVPNTNVEILAGKVTYVVQLRDTGVANLASLLSDEAKRACGHVLPSESPFVSVVFHYACAGADPTRQLVGVARIGDRSDVSVSTLLQESPPQLDYTPILKPVGLFCQEFDCLELHIADSKSGAVHFSSSRALSRITPLKPTHLNYDNQSRGGKCVSSDTQSDTRVPSVSISVLYTPSTSQYTRFEGLEVAVCNVNLPRHVGQCRDVVIGAQLVQGNSKGKTPTLGGHSTLPPFHPPRKKSGPSATPGSDPDYHISVLQYHRKELNQDSVVKSYHFFQHPLQKSESLELLFHVYGSSGPQLWWNTDNHSLVKLEITEETLTVLQTGELPLLHWSAGNNHPSQPCSVSGVLRWKSRKTKFLTESSIRDVLAKPVHVTSAPDVNQHEASSQSIPRHAEAHRTPNPGKEMPLQDSDHVLMQQESPEESDPGDKDVVKHLAEFESSLRQMAGNFRSLRRENRRLQSDNEQLAQEMATLRSQTGTSGSLTHSNLQGLSKSDLMLRVRSLQQSIETEKKTRERCQEKNRALQSDISALRELETSYIKLERVHREQHMLIQTLKGKVTKYHKCSDICRKQESVITQLESLLAKQARGHPSAKDDAISLLGRENAQLRTFLQQYQSSSEHGSGHRAALLEKDQTIQSLKSQLSQMVTRCKDLECGRGSGGGGGGAVTKEEREREVRVFELEQKLLVSEAKLSAQSTQLQENAEKWMKEKASYELQLAEYRTRLDTVIRSGQQALSAPMQVEPAASHSGKQGETEKKGGGKKYFSGKTSKKEFSF